MADIHIRQDGHAGRITLQRPKALNALTYEMCLAIETALWAWRTDPTVTLVLIDAVGDKAFCAGGDIAEIYATGSAGDFAYGQKFWRDEYRMNALIAQYPKPVVSFLHGFTMGGGVGVGCHGSHRIVGNTSQIAMPECGIGLVPDVGGSYLLARAPGRLGEFLGLTAHRIGAGDAIYAGFADSFVAEPHWDTLKTTLCASGELDAIADARQEPPTALLRTAQHDIDRLFCAAGLTLIAKGLRQDSGALASDALGKLSRNAPLAMACALKIIRSVRNGGLDIRGALELEYRFTSRSMEHGDFLEGIRAAIIDKDKSPRWRHDLDNVPSSDVDAMLRPLTGAVLTFNQDRQS